MKQLYLIISPTHLKIGVSANPYKRLKELATGSALKLKVHKTYLLLHGIYSKHRTIQ